MLYNIHMVKNVGRPAGRPSKYTPELAKHICDRLMVGESLNTICKDDDMPTKKTVLSWLLDKDKEEFLHQYEQARDVQADTLTDEMEDIAQNTPDVQRARLIIDTRKWYSSKLKPKKYGDSTTLKGDAENPLQFEVSDEKLKRIISDVNLNTSTGKRPDQPEDSTSEK